MGMYQHPTKRCDTCEFWARGDQWLESQDNEAPPDDRRGTCHRNAPRATIGEFEYEVLKHLTTIAWNHADAKQKEEDFCGWESAPLKESSWPSTVGSDWCGEWGQRDHRPDNVEPLK